MSNEYKGINDGPYFDAVISLATVWDSGELTPDIHRLETQGTSTFRTTGPLISLTGEHVIPLDLGPELPEDRAADYHPSWFGGQDDRGPPFQYEGSSNDEGMPDPDYDFWGPPIYGEQFVEGRRTVIIPFPSTRTSSSLLLRKPPTSIARVKWGKKSTWYYTGQPQSRRA